MVVHPQLLQSDRQWHQSLATVALLAAVLWIGSLDRKETNALAVQEVSDPTPVVEAAPVVKVEPLAVPTIKLTSEKGVLLPKTAIVKDRKLLMRIFAGIDKEAR